MSIKKKWNQKEIIEEIRFQINKKIMNKNYQISMKNMKRNLISKRNNFKINKKI